MKTEQCKLGLKKKTVKKLSLSQVTAIRGGAHRLGGDVTLRICELQEPTR